MDQQDLIGKAMIEARDHCSKGKLSEAAELCSAVLQVEPHNFEALHLLGLIAHDIGNNELALDLLSKAIEANPANSACFADCARVCLALGLQEDADNCSRRADELTAKNAGDKQPRIEIQPQKPIIAPAKINTQRALANSAKKGSQQPLRPKMSARQIQNAVHQAVTFHQASQFDKAEKLYREILEADANNADALQLLGLIYHQRGDNIAAVDLMQKSIRVFPTASVPHSNLGSALQELGRIDEAVEHYRRAIELDSKNAEAYLNLGTALEMQGKIEEAEACCRHVLALDPKHPKAHNNLGKLLDEKGMHKEGIEHVRQAIALNPGYAGAFSNLSALLNKQGQYEEAAFFARRATELDPDYAAAWSNWGVSCKEIEKFDEAIGLFQRALEKNPNHVESLNNIGATLWELKKYNEAIPYLERAIEIKPDYAAVYDNLGVVYIGKDLPEKAIPYFERAISLKPDNPAAHLNLGTAYRALARFDEAIVCYRRALTLKPDYPEAINNLGTIFQLQGKTREVIDFYEQALTWVKDAPMIRWNLSLALVASGDLARGWKESEYRWQSVMKDQVRPFKQPWWDGSDLSGKTILLWGEQGVGDEITYACVLPDLIKLAGHCVIECESRLVTLFARSFPTAEVVPKLNPPHLRTLQSDIHFQSPTNSTFEWIRPTLESFPHHHGFLVADPQRVDFWKKRVESLGAGIKVGISWRSRHRAALRDVHYTRIEQWAPIFAIPGLVFINLQYDDCKDELEAVRQQFGVTIHAFDDIDLMNDLDDASALTSCVDLMISVGNAAAGIAGAMGTPLWLLTNIGNWEMLGTDYIPWLPDARAFCKTLDEDWDVVISQIASSLLQVQAGRCQLTRK